MERFTISLDESLAQEFDTLLRERGYANVNETTPCFDIKGTNILNIDLPKVEKALGLS